MTALIHRWLLCLSDPSGFRLPLPTRPLPEGALSRLCQMADDHGVLPAFVANLTAALAAYDAERITAGGAAEMQAAREPAESTLRRRLAFSLVLRRQGDEILRMLCRHSLPAIIIKGAQFADRLYRPASLRSFTDVDVLVPRDALGEVDSVMDGLGYRRRSIRRKHAGDYGEEVWQPCRQPGGHVEIHWNLVNSPTVRRGVSVTYGDLRAEPPTTGGAPPLPSAAALLIIAAVHAAASHGFNRLALLYDVALICRGIAGPIDRAYLAEAARRTGAGASLRIALHLGHELLEEAACSDLSNRMNLPGCTLMNMLISPATVLRQRSGIDSLRRNIFRELLKKP